MKIRIISSLAFMIVSSVATAQGTWDGIYLKSGIGMSFGIDSNGTIGDLSGPPDDQMDFDFGKSTTYQLGLGYLVNNWFTSELSLQHSSGFDLEGPYTNDGVHEDGVNGNVNLKTTSIMLTGQVDMASILGKDWKARPYVGLGVGYAKNKIGTTTLSASYEADYIDGESIDGNTENNFAWKATLGTTYPINNKFVFDASYSYADYGQAKSSSSCHGGGELYTLNSPLTFDVKSHDVLFAVRYLF